MNDLTSSTIPEIVGIVNITEDSFSDGGRYLERDAALKHAESLYSQGADWIELGPASSHPDAAKVTPETEIARLEPVLASLEDKAAHISVDSFQPSTQLFCARWGAGMLNDTRGFGGHDELAALADFTCKLVVMFSVQGTGMATRVDTEPQEVLDAMSRFFEKRLADFAAAGIAEKRIIIDPGMGFFLGATPEPSLAALRHLPVLQQRFGRPLLVSVSRKSFLQQISGQPATHTCGATLAAELFAAAQGARYIRTHDVRELRSALLVQRALQK